MLRHKDQQHAGCLLNDNTSLCANHICETCMVRLGCSKASHMCLPTCAWATAGCGAMGAACLAALNWAASASASSCAWGECGQHQSCLCAPPGLAAGSGTTPHPPRHFGSTDMNAIPSYKTHATDTRAQKVQSSRSPDQLTAETAEATAGRMVPSSSAWCALKSCKGGAAAQEYLRRLVPLAAVQVKWRPSASSAWCAQEACRGAAEPRSNQ